MITVTWLDDPSGLAPGGLKSPQRVHALDIKGAKEGHKHSDGQAVIVGPDYRYIQAHCQAYSGAPCTSCCSVRAPSAAGSDISSSLDSYSIRSPSVQQTCKSH